MRMLPNNRLSLCIRLFPTDILDEAVGLFDAVSGTVRFRRKQSLERIDGQIE
jgi:hypothetical protein